MRKIIIVALLTLMVILSLFSGFSINGVFAFLYDYAFVSIPDQIMRISKGLDPLSPIQYIHWILTVFSHITIVLLPFIYYKYNSRRALIIFPIIFLLLQVWLLNIVSFVLIPFIVVWIFVLYLSSKTNKRVVHQGKSI
jgi:hypothetical protein